MSNNNKTRSTLREVLKQPLDFLSSICYIWWLELKSTVKDEGVLIFFLLVPLAYPLPYSCVMCLSLLSTYRTLPPQGSSFVTSMQPLM